MTGGIGQLADLTGENGMHTLAHISHPVSAAEHFHVKPKQENKAGVYETHTLRSRRWTDKICLTSQKGKTSKK